MVNLVESLLDYSWDWDLGVWAYNSTAGLVNPNVPSYAVDWVLFGLFVMLVGRLRWRDVGVDWDGLPKALLFTLSAWAIYQVGFLVIYGGFMGAPILLNPAWSHTAAGPFTGELIFTFFFNALWEDAFFKGLLVTQFFLLARRRGWPVGKSLMGSVLGAAIIFAAWHIKIRLSQGSDSLILLLGSQADLVLGACIASWLFLRTGSVLVTVGLHSMSNLTDELRLVAIDGVDFSEPDFWGLSEVAIRKSVPLLIILVVELHLWRKRRSDALPGRQGSGEESSDTRSGEPGGTQGPA